ncbi:hypothetical protein MNV49_004536 [Pseudohyphozyma bogoriensis]|nr:hypothetical protein MNV49_004536 [Pseudohyphozyma bogoriensis]
MEESRRMLHDTVTDQRNQADAFMMQPAAVRQQINAEAYYQSHIDGANHAAAYGMTPSRSKKSSEKKLKYVKRR